MTSRVTRKAPPTSRCSCRRRSAHLVWRQRAQGLDDGGQRHLRLFGHVGRAGHVVGRAADEAGTGVTCTHPPGGIHRKEGAAHANNSQVPEPTLVFHLEVSGDQRRGLTSDPCGERFSGLSLVVLDDLNLRSREREEVCL